jgi:ribosomal protein L31
MPKAEIHPTWYPDAKVICNGEVVMTTGSTSPELHVDVWSGNHPFYTGTQKILDTEGRVDRFMRKYGMGGADSLSNAAAKQEPQVEARPKLQAKVRPRPRCGRSLISAGLIEPPSRVLTGTRLCVVWCPCGLLLPR